MTLSRVRDRLCLYLLSLCTLSAGAAGCNSLLSDPLRIQADAASGGTASDGPLADLASADHGPTSGGPDAAVPDGRESDAAVPDAAVPDAPESDAAVPDAPVPDAPVPDAPVYHIAELDFAAPEVVPTESPAGCEKPTQASGNGAIIGYVSSDVEMAADARPGVLRGFRVVAGDREVMAEANGFFELDGVVPGTYQITISQPGYLKREVADVMVRKSTVVKLGSSAEPMVMWAGDINGDGFVNMADQMAMGKYGYSDAGSADEGGRGGNDAGVTAETCDLNRDGIVNKADAEYVNLNLKRTSADYPAVNVSRSPLAPEPSAATMSIPGSTLSNLEVAVDGDTETGVKFAEGSVIVQFAFEYRAGFDVVRVLLGQSNTRRHFYTSVRAADRLTGGVLESDSAVTPVATFGAEPGYLTDGKMAWRCARRIWRVRLAGDGAALDLREIGLFQRDQASP